MKGLNDSFVLEGQRHIARVAQSLPRSRRDLDGGKHSHWGNLIPGGMPAQAEGKGFATPFL